MDVSLVEFIKLLIVIIQKLTKTQKVPMQDNRFGRVFAWPWRTLYIEAVIIAID